MKRNFAKFLTMALCVAMLSASLSGCGLLERFGISLPELDLSFLDKPQEETEANRIEYTLSGKTDFYAQPSWDATVLATFYEGHTVTYTSTIVDDHGVSWALTDAGWFPLEGDKSVEILNAYDVSQEGYATQDLTIFDAPTFSAAQQPGLAAGSVLLISQIAETAEGVWAQTDNGWIPMNNLYIPGQIGQYHGYCVTRENNVVFLSVPGVQSYILDTMASGTRFEVLEQINIDGYWWGYTENGWVAMDSIYVEGTTGQRPCRVMVIDPTPLNVRIAPGTDHDVLFTLQYGQYVDILERVNYNGSDWGYTGEGWIYMDLTEIQ